MKKPVSVKILAPAKVNFYLKVVGKRPDGYHDLVSVMQALELADELTLRPAGAGVDVGCDRADVPLGDKNIAYRAAVAFMEETGFEGGVSIDIKKRTPMAAGLGGGSSDAAATLRGMSALTGLSIPHARLVEVARSLGADVPFFLSSPTALAEGVGDLLTELRPIDETWLLLVNPGILVSTKWVYESLNLGLTNSHNSIKLPQFEGQAIDAGLLVSCLHNDLEQVTADKYPLIKEIKERLIREGARGALMSGSGPTVFGVFERRHEAEKAAGRLTRPGWTVLVTRTIPAWPGPVVTIL
jgi:4-diphosphocytidyl-2-C-methyl-D-erythritol kinase